MYYSSITLTNNLGVNGFMNNIITTQHVRLSEIVGITHLKKLLYSMIFHELQEQSLMISASV